MVKFFEHKPGPSFGESLGKALGGGIQGFSEQFLKGMDTRQKMKNDELLAERLEQLGIDKKLAQFYPKASKGGQTAIIQKGLENQERETETISPTGEVSVQEESEQEELPIPKSPDIGLTNKERTKREDTRYPVNVKAHQDAENKYSSLEKEGLSWDQLDTLNQSGELPNKFGKAFNVNWKTGELRLPGAASPEAELFVKTINDFTTKAKDSFGARVTNFELNRFLKRLPGLMNSDEGRAIIIKQMKTINEIDKLQEKSLLDTFEKAGGVRKLDLDQATRHAKKSSKKERDNLIAEYKDLDKSLEEIKGQFASPNKTPGATVKQKQISKIPGKRVQSKTTGKTYLVGKNGELIEESEEEVVE